MPKLAIFTLLAVTTTIGCAHTPGRWERDLQSRKAPKAILTLARSCDEKVGTACLRIGNFYFASLSDSKNAVLAAKDACELGFASACTVEGVFRTTKTASSTTALGAP